MLSAAARTMLSPRLRGANRSLVGMPNAAGLAARQQRTKVSSAAFDGDRDVYISHNVYTQKAALGLSFIPPRMKNLINGGLAMDKPGSLVVKIANVLPQQDNTDSLRQFDWANAPIIALDPKEIQIFKFGLANTVPTLIAHKKPGQGNYPPKDKTLKVARKQAGAVLELQDSLANTSTRIELDIYDVAVINVNIDQIARLCFAWDLVNPSISDNFSEL